MAECSPRVCFTFDDGTADLYSQAFPTLAAKGVVGTAYIVSDNIGGSYVTGAQLAEMEAAGWEIGSHTKTHPYMDALTEAQARAEMADSKATLEGLGLTVRSLGAPYRKWGTDLASWAADYYKAIRAASITVPATEPLPVAAPLNVEHSSASWNSNTYTVADAEALIDAAVAADGLLVFLLHKVAASPGDNYTTTSDLA